MAEEVKLSERTQGYWDHVEKMHVITGNLLRAKEELREPDEAEMLVLFKSYKIKDEDSD